MTRAPELLAAQAELFARIDPLLPAPTAPGDGAVITAPVPDGDTVAGVLVRTIHPAGSITRTWSAADAVELTPLLGGSPRAGMHALLTAWRARLPQLQMASYDSACVVTWPSRDVGATRALLDHGFVPLSVIAVRTGSTRGTGAQEPAGPEVVVRRASPADLEAVLDLAMDELAYSALVGATLLRDDATELKREVLAARLDRDEAVWVAERADGAVIGLAECGVSDAAPGTWIGSRLRTGRWAYVNCASVRPDARGRGVGRILLDTVHAAFADADLVGSYLYYSPANPLSSVFWPRQGYRPLWTIWEVRPATALR